VAPLRVESASWPPLLNGWSAVRTSLAEALAKLAATEPVLTIVGIDTTPQGGARA